VRCWCRCWCAAGAVAGAVLVSLLVWVFEKEEDTKSSLPSLSIWGLGFQSWGKDAKRRRFGVWMLTQLSDEPRQLQKLIKKKRPRWISGQFRRRWHQSKHFSNFLALK